MGCSVFSSNVKVVMYSGYWAQVMSSFGITLFILFSVVYDQ
jgi:hypothetical protein